MAADINNMGVYMIQNMINQDFYLGCTNDFANRKIKHFSELRRNKHHCIHLQRAWNRDGEENFEFLPIEYLKDISLLNKQEYFWSNFLKPQYNTGKILETRIFKSPNKTDPNIGRYKPVLQYDLEGNFIERFESGSTLDKKYPGATNVARGGKYTCFDNKFIFIFEKEFSNENLEKRINLYYTKKKELSERCRSTMLKTINRINNGELIKNNTYKAVYQYDLNMNLIKEWDNKFITDIAKELNLSFSAITKNLNNKSRTSGGFIWKYK